MSARWTARAIQERCELLRETLRVRGAASDAEVAACWPGGAENDERGLGGWMLAYGQLFLLLGRADGREEATGGGPGADAADAMVLAALAGTPERVALGSVDLDGRPRTVDVHPKSMVALTALSQRDEAIRYLARHIARLRDDPSPAGRVLLGRALEELSTQQQLAVWIATTPGPGLPFEGDVPPAAMPEWLADVSPLDVLLILKAHHTVNSLRLHALQELIDAADEDREEGRRRPSWAVFFASAASAQQIQPERLMRDFSMCALLAMTQANAAAQREAMRASRPAGNAADDL